jgi:hypothetical protein
MVCPLSWGWACPGKFYYDLRTNWFSPTGKDDSAGNMLALCLVLGCLLNLDCVPQGNSAPHARVHDACLREVRAAQANVADIGF